MNILCSLTNCVSASAPPSPLPIAVLITVIVLTPVPAPVPASVSAPAPAPVLSSSLSFSSSSSSSSYKLSVVGLQSDSLSGLSQPLPLPSLPAFSTAFRALQAAHRVQRQKRCK